MAKGICSIEGCEREHYARGWCRPHYSRWERHGDPRYERPTSTERFWARVDVRGAGECWPWLAGGSNGYGHAYFDGKVRRAYAVAYELVIGPVPVGLTLDHTCHNADLSCAGGPACPHRRCCNPAHLEAVTSSVNTKRGRVGVYNAAKTHCPQGHPYSGENLRITATQRVCRACKRLATRQRRAIAQAKIG